MKTTEHIENMYELNEHGFQYAKLPINLTDEDKQRAVDMGADPIKAEWFLNAMACRPSRSALLNSPRGKEIEELMVKLELEDFNWHRSDPECFWIDVQLCIKYKFTDKQIRFLCKSQPGVDNYHKHAAERNAYAEMMRGMAKLRQIIAHGRIVTPNAFRQS